MPRHTLLVLAAAAGCAHAPPIDRAIETTLPAAASRAPLTREPRVVTFNLHGVRGDLVANAIRSDPALRDADVFVFEEVHGHGGCSTACEVARALGYHAVYAPEFADHHGKDDRDGSDGVAIVSRAPIDSAQVIELPYYNVHLNDERRKAALAATIRQGAGVVTIYAVHLTNRLSVRQRRAQMMPVIAHALAQHTPVIIAGDFNISPFTWIGHLIPIPTGTQDDRFEQLMRAHGFATPTEHSGATSRFLGMKLDGIYTRGFRTRDTAVAEALDVSDHMALWAELVAETP
ncbi:MAG TPA: endonuclease/exonuclease/phosphatase family protein [Kofleriaceae bacterium]|nr:endonuclease/exonuclease/phosphatase family protein [Kofleriaceae bacterium]